MIQLLITFGIVALLYFTYVFQVFENNFFHFLYRPRIRNYVQGSEGRWLYFTSYIVFLVTYLALACSKRAARRFPLNMIFLGVLVNKKI